MAIKIKQYETHERKIRTQVSEEDLVKLVTKEVVTLVGVEREDFQATVSLRKRDQVGTAGSETYADVEITIQLAAPSEQS